MSLPRNNKAFPYASAPSFAHTGRIRDVQLMTPRKPHQTKVGNLCLTGMITPRSARGISFDVADRRKKVNVDYKNKELYPGLTTHFGESRNEYVFGDRNWLNRAGNKDYMEKYYARPLLLRNDLDNFYCKEALLYATEKARHQPVAQDPPLEPMS